MMHSAKRHHSLKSFSVLLVAAPKPGYDVPREDIFSGAGVEVMQYFGGKSEASYTSEVVVMLASLLCYGLATPAPYQVL